MVLATAREETDLFPRLLENLGFFPKISRPWKVLENESDPGKFWNLLVVQIIQKA